MTQRVSSLRRRVLIATIAVALVAVLFTAIAALQLVRTADTAQARDTLSTQADRLAAARPAVRDALVNGLSELDNPDVLVASVPKRGLATGSAAAIVPRRSIVAVRAGRSVSTTVESGGSRYLVEGRPTTGGGGVLVAQNVNSVQPVTPAVLARLLIALAIGLAAAIIAAIIATRTLTRPLTRLASAARRMAGGERGVALEPSSVAEVNEVEGALRALDRALVHSEGRQREFLLEISHELRTPLTAIRGYAEALSDGVVEADQVPAVGRTLQVESERLTVFTNDLLALARLEADDFTLTVADLDVTEVLGAAARAWQATATAAGVLIEVTVTTPVHVRSDAARLRQLVDGLLENALRVSVAGSSIGLGAGATPSGVRVEVSDGGPGLTANDAAVAFERGMLRDRYRDLRPVGSGLGLSIAARLVGRMGGQISAHPAPGGGALFRIELPAA